MTKRRGSRTPPSGKGVYVCRGGDCLARLLSEKRFKRMFTDAMEDACAVRLRALLGPTGAEVAPSASTERLAKIEGRDSHEQQQ